MAINLNALTPDFREKLETLLTNCENAGYIMKPYFGIRTPIEQGGLWRQSRTGEEVQQQIQKLKDQGAEFLAYCIEAAGPKSGPHVTNALPGMSWHQWGEAADSVWVVDGKENWSTDQLVNGKNGYAVYAEQAKAIGLDAGGYWRSFKDWPHVQLRKTSSPLGAFTLKQINDTMKERFGV